jgi:hypothetical protein
MHCCLHGESLDIRQKERMALTENALDRVHVNGHAVFWLNYVPVPFRLWFLFPPQAPGAERRHDQSRWSLSENKFLHRPVCTRASVLHCASGNAALHTITQN